MRFAAFAECWGLEMSGEDALAIALGAALVLLISKLVDVLAPIIFGGLDTMFGWLLSNILLVFG